MSLTRCPKCNNIVPPENKFCVECGTPRPSAGWVSSEPVDGPQLSDTDQSGKSAHLSPEERRRIYEEEKARIEAEKQVRAETTGARAPVAPEHLINTQQRLAATPRKIRFDARKVSLNSWLVFLVVAMALLLFVILPGANYLVRLTLRAFSDGGPHPVISQGSSGADVSRDQYHRMSAHYAAGKYADAIDDFSNFDDKSSLYPKAVAMRNQAEEHIVPVFAKAVAARNLDQAETLVRYIESQDLSAASRAKFAKALGQYQVQREAADQAQAKAAQAQAAAEQLSQRRAFAPILEDLYLKSGRDVHVSVEGPDSTTLHLTYVLMSRPMAYNMSNDTDLVDGWRKMGFRKVIFDDGYDHTWVTTL